MGRWASEAACIDIPRRKGYNFGKPIDKGKEPWGANLCEKRLFLLDMDGTLYLDETLFDGSAALLQYIRSTGGRYLFFDE